VRRAAALATALATVVLLAACEALPPPVRPQPPLPVEPRARFEPVDWNALPGWREDDLEAAWTAFAAGCRALKSGPLAPACARGAALPPSGQPPDAAALRAFLEREFVPWRIVAPDGRDQGLITGYFEPLLTGSRKRGGRFQHPLHAVPDDLLVIDLGAQHPQLKGMRLRGRLEGRRVVPYHDRARIVRGLPALAGRALAYVDSAFDAFFLHIQGSGRIRLDDGSILRLGFAEQNGHPYVPIGRVLIERGELAAGEVTMQSIRAWAQRHPEKLGELLERNPSYVFFRELPPSDGGPPGSLGVPLTAGRSIAVDRRVVPLGAPVFLATRHPVTEAPLERLVFAQDTGGAIVGAIRADYFWGFGDEAGEAAGRQRHPGRMWLLWPRGAPPPQAVGSER
jgi:membrane-bound lytic murein transglycosylase A